MADRLTVTLSQPVGASFSKQLSPSSQPSVVASSLPARPVPLTRNLPLQILIFFVKGDQRRSREDRERQDKESQHASDDQTHELPALSAS